MIKIETIAAQKGYRVVDGIPHGKKGPLKASPDSKGYLRFNVTIYTGRSITCWVHRLVAFQKFGEAIHAPGIDVRHLDGDKQNNRDENIAIGSRSENLKDTPPAERSARARRMNETKHGETRQKIDASLAAGNGIRGTARNLGVAISTVYNRNLKRKDRN